MPRRHTLPDKPPPHSTEWPRWEVMKQDAPGKAHQMVGSVHAVDAEQALLNARHVFVRRPSAVSLWVAPAVAFAHASAEGETPQPEAAAEEEQTWLVFGKASQRRSMVYGDFLGQVEAAGPQAALEAAQAAYPDTLAWWVVPAEAVAKSDDDPGTVASWFEPAKEKTYRQQSQYGVVGRHVSAHRPAKGEQPGAAKEGEKA